MYLRVAAATFALSFALPALADVDADLDFIVAQTASHEIFEGALAAQRPLIVSAIENELRKNDVAISDIDIFIDIYFEEFLAEFVEAMQQQTAKIYRAEFTDQQLADLATFYRSPTGEKLINVTPELMAMGARHGQVAGLQAGKNAMPRVKKRIEKEGVGFESIGFIDKFLGR